MFRGSHRTKYGVRNLWDADSTGISSKDNYSNDWDAVTGWGVTNCFNSSNCSSGYRCSGGKCVKVNAVDSRTEPGESSSHTTDGGCSSGGQRSAPSGSRYSTNSCGSVTGSPSSCTRATCSNTGNDGLNSVDNAGCDKDDRCCRASGIGTVICMPGLCGDDTSNTSQNQFGENDTGKPCNGFCNEYKSANGTSFSGQCEELECSECTFCGQGNTCVTLDNAPCHCESGQCADCEKCNRGTGNCEPTNCRSCRTGPVRCSGGGVKKITACGESPQQLEEKWAQASAAACIPKDPNDPDKPNKNCRTRIGIGQPPTCPSGYACNNVGVIKNEESGTTYYLQNQCKRGEPDSPEEAEDWPCLPGDNDCDGWDDAWWDRINSRCDGLGDQPGFSCPPGSLCAFGGTSCVDDPNVPGDGTWRECQADSTKELCPDGSCCPDGKSCSPIGEGGSFGCCNSGFQPLYTTKFRYPDGSEFSVASLGEPLSGATYGSGMCTVSCSSTYGSGLHVTYTDLDGNVSGLAAPCGSTTTGPYGGTRVFNTELDTLSDGRLIRLKTCDCYSTYGGCDGVPQVYEVDLTSYTCLDED